MAVQDPCKREELASPKAVSARLPNQCWDEEPLRDVGGVGGGCLVAGHPRSSEPDLELQEGERNELIEKGLLKGVARGEKPPTKEAHGTERTIRPEDLTPMKIVRTMLFSVYLPVVLLWLNRSLVLAALPLLVMELGGDSSDVGVLVALYGVGYTAANIPGGVLLATTGPRTTLLVSCACFAGSALVCLGSERISLFCMASFLLGLALSMSTLAQQTLITNFVPLEYRGMGLSTMAGFTRFAMALGPCIAGVLQEQLGAQYVFALQVVVSLAAAANVAACTPGPPPEHLAARDGGQAKGTGCVGITAAKEAVVNHGALLWRVLVFSFTLQFVRKGREMFFPLAGKAAGLSANRVGQVTALSYLLDMGCSPIAGRLMDTRGRVVAGGLSATVMSVGVLVLVGQTPAAAAVSAIVTGVGNGFSAGLMMTFVSDLSPSGSGRGPFIAAYRSLANCTEFVAPVLLGILAAATSLRMSELLAGAVGLFGVAWVSTCVPETLRLKAASANLEGDLPPSPVSKAVFRVRPGQVGLSEALEAQDLAQEHAEEPGPEIIGRRT